MLANLLNCRMIDTELLMIYGVGRYTIGTWRFLRNCSRRGFCYWLWLRECRIGSCRGRGR